MPPLPSSNLLLLASPWLPVCLPFSLSCVSQQLRICRSGNDFAYLHTRLHHSQRALSMTTWHLAVKRSVEDTQALRRSPIASTSRGQFPWREAGPPNHHNDKVHRQHSPRSVRAIHPEREFFVDNLLVRIHFIIVMIRWDRPRAVPSKRCRLPALLVPNHLSFQHRRHLHSRDRHKTLDSRSRSSPRFF